MSSDLPDRLLGLSIDESDDRRPGDGGDGEEEEYVRFIFVELGERRLAIAVDDVESIIDPPESLTRVPRSPRAIEGVTDLRGVITALVDLRYHFPTRSDPPDDERLVVFETGADQQPAAVRVDDVLGVESVPEGNVVDERDLATDSFEDVPFGAHDVNRSVLDHPLIVAAVVKEPGVELGIDDLLPGQRASDEREEDVSTSSFGNRIGLDRETDGVEFDEVMGESGSDVDDREPDRLEETLEVETTGLLDVDRLLLASGRP